MKLFFLFFISATLIACSKNDNTNPPVVNPPSTPHDTLSAGWSETSTGSHSQLIDIFFINNQFGFTNSDNAIYKSTDGGNTWMVTDSSGSFLFNNLAVTPNGNLYATSGENTIFKIVNGNAIVAQNIKNIAQDADIFFTSNDSGYITRGFNNTNAGLWQTIDGGVTWKLIPLQGYSPNVQSYLSFAGNKGYCTGLKIYYTDLTQSNWSVSGFSAKDSFISVSAVNTMVAYVAGHSGTIYKTKDGGKTFNKAGAFDKVEAFLDLAFVDEQTGYATNGHQLYKTSDGGKTWSIAISLLEDIFIELHFTDATHGWACGGSGRVFIYRG